MPSSLGDSGLIARTGGDRSGRNPGKLHSQEPVLVLSGGFTRQHGERKVGHYFKGAVADARLVIDVAPMRPVDPAFALNDQVIAIYADCRLLGDEPSDLSADNEMFLSFEYLYRRSPRRYALLPLPDECLRNVKRDLYVNC